jgi:multiple sugar transport system ATP-binding protein
MVDVRIEGLTKVFETVGGRTVAVKDLDLEIDHGEFFTFVGPSGCGKTTSLRMIAGLETPTSGDIYFDDKPVTDLSPQNRDIAMVFQNPVLYPHMTNYDNIGYGLKVRGETEGYDERVREAADLLEISEQLGKKPSQISGGQQQRVALGRAIVRDPNVILFDEPMSDLDAKLKADLRVQVQRLHQELDTTMVYVTHDQEEAMTMSTRIGLMNDGRLVQVDEPEQLYTEPINRFSAQFIGQPTMNLLDGVLTDGSRFHIGDNGRDYDIDLTGLQSSEQLNGENQRLQLGFRPQHAVLTDDEEGLFSAVVDVVEPVGNHYIVYLTDDLGNEIKVVTEDVSVVEPGKTMGIERLTSFYLFDSETGATLAEQSS